MEDLPAIEQRHSKRSPKDQAHAFSEWSHQAVIEDVPEVAPVEEEEEWQTMPAFAQHDIYDDESGKVIAHALTEAEIVTKTKGYSRVQGDDDAKSVDSVDEQTNHLFNANADHDDEATVDSQLSYTKNLLTEGQRIAYIGICKLVIVSMLKEMTIFNSSGRGEGRFGLEGLILWSQKVTVALYLHLEISPEEQLMMEQLSEHHILPEDLAPALTTATRVSNPMRGPVEKIQLDEETSTQAPECTTDTFDAAKAESLDLDIRWTVLFDLFLLLLSDSVYDARSRVFFIAVSQVLGVSYLELVKFEKKVTDALEVQENAGQPSLAEEGTLVSAREKTSRKRRYAMMGLATLGGGLVIGLSAGLLAPVIGAGLGAAFTTVGVSGATSFLAGGAGAALITTGGVVTGSAIATKSAGKRTSSVKTFEFKPLYDNKRVNLLLTVPGWLAGSEDDVRLPFSTIDPVVGDICSILWEPELLRTFQATGNILATEVLTQSLQQVLGQTVLTALMSALQWPLVLTKLSYLIDNPWSNSLDRAKAAGLILADSLVSRVLGQRPISLVGYSLGARVIHYALLELARVKAYGIVENVYLFGAPVVVSSSDWRNARTVVAGRFINGYVQNDWILGYLFRATSGGIGRVAGLRPVEGIATIENLDVTEHVTGHMGYREAIPRLMKMVGFEITSEEFEEIEDPDPDKTRERARELLEDIEAARAKNPNPKPKRSLFSWRSKNLVTPEALPTAKEPPVEQFDVDKIRNEANKTFAVGAMRQTLDRSKSADGPANVERPPLTNSRTSTAPEEEITMSFGKELDSPRVKAQTERSSSRASTAPEEEITMSFG